MGYPIKQSSTAQPLVFLMVADDDHLTGKTGLSPTVTLSKAGGSFASPSGAVSEIGNGWYKVAGNATDSNTLGPLVLHASASGADDSDDRFDVVAFDPQVATNLGLSALPTANPGANGGVPTVDGNNNVHGLVPGTGTGQINMASGKVPATLASSDVTGNVAADLQTIKTQTVTCGAGVTVGAFVGNATAAIAVTAAGRLDVGLWLGTAPLSLSSQQVQAIVPDTQKVDVNTIKTQAVTCSASITVSPFVGSTGAAINGTNANTLSSHDPGATLGTSTLTQAQVTGGSYALNSSSFAFAAAFDFTSTQKTSLNAATPAVTVSDKTGFALTSAYDAAKTAAQAGDAMALTSSERNSTADALLDRANGIETGVTLRQAIRYSSSILVGVISGAGTGTEVFKAIGNSGTTRVTVTVDSSGNRSVMVLA